MIDKLTKFKPLQAEREVDSLLYVADQLPGVVSVVIRNPIPSPRPVALTPDWFSNGKKKKQRPR